MFSELKALVDSEIFTSKHDPIPYVEVKFRVNVFVYMVKQHNLELGIFTFKHDSP